MNKSMEKLSDFWLTQCFYFRWDGDRPPARMTETGHYSHQYAQNGHNVQQHQPNGQKNRHWSGQNGQQRQTANGHNNHTVTQHGQEWSQQQQHVVKHPGDLHNLSQASFHSFRIFIERIFVYWLDLKNLDMHILLWNKQPISQFKTEIFYFAHEVPKKERV